MKNRWILVVLIVVGCVFFVGCVEQSGLMRIESEVNPTITPPPTPTPTSTPTLAPTSEPMITKSPMEMALAVGDVSSNWEQTRTHTAEDPDKYTVWFEDKDKLGVDLYCEIIKYSTREDAQSAMDVYNISGRSSYDACPSIEFGDEGIGCMDDVIHEITYRKTNVIVRLYYGRLSGITAEDITEINTYAGIIEDRL